MYFERDGVINLQNLLSSVWNGRGGLSRSFCVPHLRSRAATERADSGDTGGCVRDYMQYFINNGLVVRSMFLCM